METTIDLADINFSGSGPSLAYSRSVLSVSDGTHVAKLNMIGNFTLASFHAAPDGSGGTLITDPPLLGSAPPTTPSGLDHVAALFNQSIAAGFSDQNQHGVQTRTRSRKSLLIRNNSWPIRITADRYTSAT